MEDQLLVHRDHRFVGAHRDSAEAPLAEGWSDERGCGVVLHTHLPGIKMRAGFWMRMLASLVLAGLSSACGSEGPVSKSIAGSVEKGPGTRLVLAEHTGFPWDKVCILGPYTPDDKVDSLRGIQGAAGQAHDIRSNDGINVLMFVRDARIAASVAHARNRGDFGREVVGKCYSREQANFSVRVPPANSRARVALCTVAASGLRLSAAAFNRLRP